MDKVKAIAGIFAILFLSGCYGKRLNNMQSEINALHSFALSQIEVDKKVVEASNQMNEKVNKHIQDNSIHNSTAALQGYFPTLKKKSR
jgi:hypothetical protein